MSSSYIPYQPEQQQLLPSALQDWLPQGHLAYFISDTVDSLDLSDFHARYAAGGPRNQPFHPVMIVKVLVYAYATGTFSSRKIARKLFEDVAFRVLAADNFPAHRTIRDFRALHLAEFTELFTQVVRLAREMGLVKLGTIAVDGLLKIKANASRHKAMSYGRMQTTEVELKAQIAALLQKAANADEAEKNEPDLDIPAEIERRQARLVAIAAAKARLEERQRQDIAPGTLSLHADRGASMRSKPVASLLVDLDITKSHSRPYTSDDNPYSEAQFKTLKYRPDFPERFGSIEDARAHCQTFFAWYNNEHRHSGIAYMTPHRGTCQ